jgi:hypothetical protein
VQLAPILLLGMGAAILLPAFAAFDGLVKREYELHPNEWEADGQPYGMFWRPQHRWFVPLRSGWATQRCMLVWLFRTPRWTLGDDDATRLLRRLRRLTLAWNLAMILFIGFLIASAFPVR